MPIDLTEHCKKWLALASSCDPADRGLAEKSIAALYVRAGYTAPEFTWVASPPAAVDLAVQAGLHRRDDLWDDLRATEIKFEPAEPHPCTCWSFRQEVFSSRLFPVDSVGINFGYRHHGDDLGSIVSALYARDEKGLKCLDEGLDDRASVCRSVWHWWPYRGVCIVSERPVVAHVSNEGRLHSVRGPAVAYRDGWEIYAVNGEVLNPPARDRFVEPTP